MIRTSKAFILLLAATSATASTGRAGSLEMRVSLIEGPSCRIDFARERYWPLKDGEGERLQTALKKAHGRSSRLRIVGDKNTPWRCVGGAMTFAQRAGLKPTYVEADPKR